MNEFNGYVRDVFSSAGDIVTKSMMGGFLVYLYGMYTELPEKKLQKPDKK